MSEIDISDYEFARLAVDKAKLCAVDASSRNPPPRVAVVIAMQGKLLGWYAKGVGGQVVKDGVPRDFTAKSNAHAEQALLEALSDQDLSNATAFVTLEPCTKKKGKGQCCADLIVQSKLKSIFIANSDPNPDVGNLAWKTFFENGVEVHDFLPELRGCPKKN